MTSNNLLINPSNLAIQKHMKYHIFASRLLYCACSQA